MTITVEYLGQINTFEYEGDVGIWNYADGPVPQGQDIKATVTHRMKGNWNVSKAQEIVKDRPISNWMYPAELDSLGKNVRIDEEYAMAHSDLKSPVIAVKIVIGEGTDFFVIDGWHRIYKARQLGVEMIPVHILNDSDSELVTISWTVTPL